MKMGLIGWIAMILLIVGGLNWGLIGLLDFDLVGFIFGAMSIVSRIVFILVGLSAIYVLFTSTKKNQSSMPTM